MIMKKLTILFIVFLLSNYLHAQEWEWLNPLPQAHDLHSIYFIDSNTAFAVG
jgi:hypothetical protein